MNNDPTRRDRLDDELAALLDYQSAVEARSATSRAPSVTVSFAQFVVGCSACGNVKATDDASRAEFYARAHRCRDDDAWRCAL